VGNNTNTLLPSSGQKKQYVPPGHGYPEHEGGIFLHIFSCLPTRLHGVIADMTRILTAIKTPNPTYRIPVGKPHGKRPLVRPRCRMNEDIKIEYGKVCVQFPTTFNTV
jgi:hypothetical protein